MAKAQYSCQAAHSVPHHNVEHATMVYVYDPVSHYMVARTHSTCYFMALNIHQIHQIHEVNGLEQVELQMVASINGEEEKLSQSIIAHVYRIVDHTCKHHTLLLVNSTPATTPQF
ncbi:uncharacterized protein LOC132547054 [Ylistrum balloti]|uniref:uncharacterized protein LOC132547054 n=1 Tax=Ylistrum balloti TaxID=509963 RepID=UPI002905A4F4|nr:uncharacterized protein LOC132547054 [Ylistrum balloti]